MRKIIMRTADSAVVIHDFQPSDFEACHVDLVEPDIPMPNGDIAAYAVWEKQMVQASVRAAEAQRVAMLALFEPIASPMTTEVPPTDPLKKEVWDRLVSMGVEINSNLAIESGNS